ncbi:BHLH family transcription factor [Plectosphaerella cucumerina]|uniref:BHLH family transcription factor n=1 Tax=Plectosphaerella cucumerina TaxID=40658 RepID=A0A8K0T7X3_9PEZI|nr:BHLH family transcription factor [Plectosphaerella cucumerina]
MGSSQPSDSHLPFGYAFDAEDFLFEPPPDPAPGAPLLSDNDSKMISSFFDDMSADHYNVPSFGEGLNYSDAWLQLPPQFMGTATSLGQPAGLFGGSLASPSHDMSQHDFGDMMVMGSSMMPPPVPSRPAPPIPQARHHLEQQQQSHFQPLQQQQLPQQHIQQQQLQPQHQHQHQQHHQQQQYQQHASADVLAAATLLQNGSSSRSNLGPSRSGFSQRNQPPSLGPPVGHLRHQPLEEFKRAERMNSFGEPLMGGPQQVKLFNDMVFGSVLEGQEPVPSPPLRRTSQPPVEVQWGSDTRFSRSTSYVPDSARETYDALEAHQLSYMACIEPSKSAATTRPSSPSPNGESSTARPQARNGLPTETADEEAGDVPPRKRRKSRNNKDDPEEDDESTGESTGKGSKKRKGKADGPAASGENGTSGKRRKSGPAAAKAARENLSEAQKRENHIRSEQKRRTLIKEGFDDLCDLVPGLKGGGFSKSTMLTMAAEWLEDMLRGNQQLAAQLEALEGR